jgi:hypothetical protein
MYLLLAFAVTAAALLAAALWWIRRTNLAVYPVGRQPLQLRPLPVGCDLGQKLLMASTDAPPAPAKGGGGGGGGGREEAGGAARPNRPGGAGATPPPPARSRPARPAARSCGT